jgi:hypothetical protein
MIELRRRKKGERIERFKHQYDGAFANLRSRLRRWSSDNTEALRGCAPEMPDTFENRRADNWRLQFAIADLGGEDWGNKARVAAIKIEGGSDSRTVGARLLADSKAVFFQKDDLVRDPLERISSADLIAQLCAYEDSPWKEWKGGKQITQAQLARLLKPHGIAPLNIRMPGDSVVRGYQRVQFEDAWDTYL